MLGNREGLYLEKQANFGVPWRVFRTGAVCLELKAFSLLFTNHVGRALIVPNPEKHGLPQSVVPGSIL